MKKILKYFLFMTIFAICFVTNVRAIDMNEIDYEGEVITYNDSTENFILSSECTNCTVKYQWIMVSGDGEELRNAYNNYLDNDSEANKLTLNNALSPLSVDDNNWSNSSEPTSTLASGKYYIRWAKVTNNSTSNVCYGFGIYKASGSSSSSSSDVTNPDTGINTLYAVPVVIILGSVLLFKKRRYE